MSIIIPGANQLEHDAIETIKSAVGIPQGLQAAMATNPKLAATLMPTVLEAVRRSFTNPETAMRVLTASALKERVAVCLEAMRIMYCEQELSLHQCYACLMSVLAKALTHAKRAEDIAAASQRPGIYGRDTAEKQQVEVSIGDGTDLAAGAGIDDAGQSES